MSEKRNSDEKKASAGESLRHRRYAGKSLTESSTKYVKKAYERFMEKWRPRVVHRKDR
jgi:hypothetical protein